MIPTFQNSSRLSFLPSSCESIDTKFNRNKEQQQHMINAIPVIDTPVKETPLDTLLLSLLELSSELVGCDLGEND